MIFQKDFKKIKPFLFLCLFWLFEKTFFSFLSRDGDFGIIYPIVNEFDNSLHRISEIAVLLNSFKTKDDAINYLVEETHLSLEECTNAYNIYINLYKINK